MTHDRQGRYSSKDTADREHDPALVEEIARLAGDRGLTCGDAERLAKSAGASMDAVGAAADSREIKLVKCQIGLFGYETATGKHPAFAAARSVAPELERALRGALAGGRLPCAAAWAVAADFGLGRLDVACAAEALGLKITPCQLGAF